MKDYCLISTAYQGQARIYVAYSKQMVERARTIHGTWPTASAALGRFLIASSMMGLMLKEDDTITLRIEGDGPIEYMLVEANASGTVRGDIKNPEVYLTYNNGPKAGKLAVGKAVGEGYLHVTKDLNLRQNFTSSIELQTGEIGDDFTYYFTFSEQTPSAVGLGVLVDIDQSIKQAGGFIVQLLPNASEDTIKQIEVVLSKIKAVTELFEDGLSPEDITDLLSNGTAKTLSKHDIQYACPCSKDKFSKSIEKLDNKTIQSFIDEDHGAEIVCHFCKTKYHFDEAELKSILNQKKS